jgi:hypothetical protein
MTEIRRFPQPTGEPARRKRLLYPPAARLSAAPAQTRMTLLAARALWGAALVAAPAGIVSAGVIADGSGSAVPASPAAGPALLTADNIPATGTAQPSGTVQPQAAPASSGAAAQTIQWPSVPVQAAPPPTTLPIKGAWTLSGSIFDGIGVAGSMSADSNGTAISVTPGFGVGGDVKLSGTVNGSVPTNGLQIGITAKNGDSFGPFPFTPDGPLPAVSLKGTINVPLFSIDPDLNASFANLGNTSVTLEGSVKGVPYIGPFSGSMSTKFGSGTSVIGFDPTIQSTSSDGTTYSIADKLFDFGSTRYVGPTFRVGLTWDQWAKVLSTIGEAEFTMETGQTFADAIGPSTQSGQVTVSAPVAQPIPYLDYMPGAQAGPVNPITGVPDTEVGPFGMLAPGAAQQTPNQVVADSFASLQAPPGTLTGSEQAADATSQGILGTNPFGTYMLIPPQAPSAAFAWPAPPASTNPATESPLPGRTDAGTPPTSEQATATPTSTPSPAGAASPADTVSTTDTTAQADASQAAAPQEVVQADAPQEVVQADAPQEQAPVPAPTQLAGSYDPTSSDSGG